MKEALLFLGTFLVLAGAVKLVIALIMRRKDNG